MMRGMMAFSQTGHRSGVLLGRAHESADEAHAVGQRRGPTHRVARGPVVDVGHLDAGVVEPCPAQPRQEVLLLEGSGDAARPCLDVGQQAPRDAGHVALEEDVADREAAAGPEHAEGLGTVSYTHLTLPTIYSV